MCTRHRANTPYVRMHKSTATNPHNKMILKLIILLSICQIVLYRLLDKLGFKYGKSMLFLVILIGHFVVFPPYFYPKPNPDRVACGLPVLGVMLAFWIFGAGVSTIIHVLYEVTSTWMGTRQKG
jgi:hypothetical protein